METKKTNFAIHKKVIKHITNRFMNNITRFREERCVVIKTRKHVKVALIINHETTGANKSTKNTFMKQSFKWNKKSVINNRLSPG